jgi:hypothetical protein
MHKVKTHQWATTWLKIFIDDIRAPLTDTAARLQFFSLIALLIFVLPPSGFIPWKEEIDNTWRAIQAFFYALPAFVLLNAVLASFKAFSEIKKHGVWEGNRYVFHEPMHIKTVVVTDGDNGKLIPFKIEGFPERASVDLTAKIDEGFDNRNVRVQFIYMKDQPITWDEYERRNCLALIPETKELYIATHKQTPSNASIVKIYIHSWYALPA